MRSATACPPELLRELLHAASGIDQPALPRVSRVRITRHVAQDHEVFLAVDRLLAVRTDRRAGQKPMAGGNVDKCDVVELGMNFGFHVEKEACRADSALPRFESRIRFADHVEAPTATDHLAIRVTTLGRLEGRDNFHKPPNAKNRAMAVNPGVAPGENVPPTCRLPIAGPRNFSSRGASAAPATCAKPCRAGQFKPGSSGASARRRNSGLMRPMMLLHIPSPSPPRTNMPSTGATIQAFSLSSPSSWPLSHPE